MLGTTPHIIVYTITGLKKIFWFSVCGGVPEFNEI